MPLKYRGRQDNDPNYTTWVAKEWFRVNEMEVMNWPAQSPDLNPIENLLADVKKAVWNDKPKNQQRVVDHSPASMVKYTIEKIPGSRRFYEEVLYSFYQKICYQVLRIRIEVTCKYHPIFFFI
uniref:Transposable element Tcb2 transposase n=1 Tax=Zeugodacus cucurbitae TaxID=28588 RepID=A0A0A1X5G1_ZEUCU